MSISIKSNSSEKLETPKQVVRAVRQELLKNIPAGKEGKKQRELIQSLSSKKLENYKKEGKSESQAYSRLLKNLDNKVTQPENEKVFNSRQKDFIKAAARLAEEQAIIDADSQAVKKRFGAQNPHRLNKQNIEASTEIQQEKTKIVQNFIKENKAERQEARSQQKETRSQDLNDTLGVLLPGESKTNKLKEAKSKNPIDEKTKKESKGVGQGMREKLEKYTVGKAVVRVAKKVVNTVKGR